ncbi:MAG TPA: hypothetical protein VIN07_05535 [Flavipsychrobacter sp.]
MIQHLKISSFFAVWQQYPGLIPVSLRDGVVIWQDVSTYHFYEGFFHKSLNNLKMLRKEAATTFSTDIGILKDDRFAEESLPLSGFIFHTGRCGSTLLTKVLACSRDNHIISEAQPLNMIFSLFANGGSVGFESTLENRTIYKNLLLSLARKRLNTHQRCFVKFSSYNIHFSRFIQTVFPEVPAIFITRDTYEVVASFQKKPAAWMDESNFLEIKNVYGLPGNNLEEIVTGFKKEADRACIKQVSNKELKPENIAHICSQFNYTPESADIGKMKQQFLYDSKVEFNKKQFER